jgi:MFS family permease
VIRRIFRTLRYRDFRLFFVGQGVSLVGTQMQVVAMSWLVYRLSGSAALLGLVNFVARAPTFFFAPLAGIWVDRMDRRKAFWWIQVLFMIQAAILAVLALEGRVRIWHLFVLGSVLGVLNGFEVPVRQSLIFDVVEDKAELGNALALNVTIINGTNLLGPLLAGSVIAFIGEGPCFAANAVSFVAVLGCVLAMGPGRPGSGRAGRNGAQAFREGWHGAFGSPSVRSLLLLLFLVSLLGISYPVLLPVFAKDILHGGPEVLGYLGAAGGVGALAGTLYMASRAGFEGMERLLALSAVTIGLCLAAFAFSRTLWLSLLLQVPVGLGTALLITGIQTLVQNLVEDGVRGRIMSFYTMAFMGTVPFGGLFLGLFAQRFGAGPAVCAGGLGCAAAGTYFWMGLEGFRAHVRTILERKGLLPEAAASLP